MIAYIKFVELYTLKNFEPQNITRIEQKINKKYLFVKKKICSKNFSDFYIMRVRVFHLQNKKEKGMSSTYFFQNWAKTIRKYGKIHTRLIHLDGRNLIGISQKVNINTY